MTKWDELGPTAFLAALVELVEPNGRGRALRLAAEKRIDRRPLGCKACGKVYHRPFRSQTCPDCRAARDYERAQERRHAVELARIKRMGAAELEALLSRLAGYAELCRAFRGNPRTLRRIRVRARAAAVRLNELGV